MVLYRIISFLIFLYGGFFAPVLFAKNNEPSPFWQTLQQSFQLSDYTQRKEVQEQIQWLVHHKHYVERVLSQAVPYIYFVYQQSQLRHLPGELVLLPLIESTYDPFAYSYRGAAGLWQLMPDTAHHYGLTQNWWYDERRDIYASTKAALDFLASLNKMFSGDWMLAIAAYDSGSGVIQTAIARNQNEGLNTDFFSLLLPQETRTYVPRLLAYAAIISAPAYYDVTLPEIKNQAYFSAVDLDSQIDLTRAAQWAGISVKKLYALNPGFNRFTTKPGSHHHLVLPVERMTHFKNNLRASQMY